MAMPTDLNTPILEGGLERIPFFNGRVLTAEDLSTEQSANAAERRRVGRALGTGVVEGLFVRSTGESTTVIVESGMALAPSGRVVELPQRTEVSVVSEIDRQETAGTEGQFANCSTQHAIVTSGTGAYLLVLEPASDTRGRVPRTNLGGDGAAGECGAQHRIEGARLRLVCLDTNDSALVPASMQAQVENEENSVEEALEDGDTPTPAATSRLRNLLAHACLRTPSARSTAGTLYDTLRGQSRGDAPRPTGAIEVLRDRDGLSSDTVPIGLLYWARNRILFVDVWSVRRRIHRPHPQRPAPATARRRAEMEAAVFQFQDHLADVGKALTAGQRQLVRAGDYLQWLPPVGLLPVQSSASSGFRREAFFEELTTRDIVVIEGARVAALFDDALQHTPIPVQSKELVWRYEVRENRQAAERGDAVPYLLFSTGHQPFFGDPRYNLSRWDHSNYDLGLGPR